MHATAQVPETIAKLVPGGEQCLSHLSDDELLTTTRRLVGASNKLFAQLLLHMAEVETRGIHRTRACASLYTYCIYELRMSEDAAARRSSAARLVKRFPLLFHAVAAGELHLTGLLMLGPHLTPENHVEVLARAKFRTKKELAKLVRELNPLPFVPDLMVPLGPEPPRPLRAPTWEEWVASLCPPVRDLKPTRGHADLWTRAEDAPREWANGTGAGATAEVVMADAVLDADSQLRGGGATETEDPFSAPAQCRPPITAPQQYQMQFSTTEAHVQLVERAKALLARSSPCVSLGELHWQAMQLLVEKLEKKRFAVMKHPRDAKSSIPEAQTPEEASRQRRGHALNPLTAPRQRGEATDSATAPPQRDGSTDSDEVIGPGEAPRQRGDDLTIPTRRAPRQRGGDKADPTQMAPRQRGRHVPAAVKREVFARDAGCCSYVDERGQRCSETRYLELHHLKPFARGGEHVASNLALRCAAHNTLAAEEDFGQAIIEQRRNTARHASVAAEERPRDR